ncbi:hypothetical protein RND71_042652 [Anisodus tanguticus]|uniref:Uncharacterized protein n=1 Tax=Anisodus tanguticus TaxID=243964 RepID=A0AAE1QR20_9SOLA|nr:hypothetical protein RND71_042652 [Anisodus tanguticus]
MTLILAMHFMFVSQVRGSIVEGANQQKSDKKTPREIAPTSKTRSLKQESPNNSDNYDSSRDSDKSIFERLQREFEAARASQTQELTLEGEQWNDGLLATIRERVHMEAERKAMQIPGDTTQLPIPFHEKITYKVGNKSFTDHVGDLLQAYVDRREQVRLIKELYGNQIGEFYHSLPYHMIEFVLEDFDSKVTVGLRYADLISTLPTGVSVLAWPMHQSKKSSDTIALSQKGNGVGSHPIIARLTYAENALRNMSLPEGFASFLEFASATIHIICLAMRILCPL